MFLGSGIATVNNPGVKKVDDKHQTRTPKQPHREDNSDLIAFVYARYNYTLTGLRSQIWELNWYWLELSAALKMAILANANFKFLAEFEWHSYLYRWKIFKIGSVGL